VPPPRWRAMKRRFLKMHGLGNDFVIFDARDKPLEMDGARAAALADRRTGIGCDQLIVVERSANADARMRIWNPDGGEVESCGNAARCVAALIGGDCRIETAGGLLTACAASDAAIVDMGSPRFGWHEIPLAYPMDTAAMPVAWEELSAPFAVNVGNPHVVFFVDDAQAVDLERLGPLIECDALFPERVNVGVAAVGPDGIDLRVWERGAGITLACGTGACAAAVAAITRGLATSPVEIRLPGGALIVEWEKGGEMRMSGPVAFVFEGEVAL
jgi:diaminopimelate epimerase